MTVHQVFDYVCDQCNAKFQSMAAAAVVVCPRAALHSALMPKINGVVTPTGTPDTPNT